MYKLYVLFATKTLSVVLIVKLNVSKISEVFPFTFGDAVISNSLAEEIKKELEEKGKASLGQLSNEYHSN